MIKIKKPNLKLLFTKEKVANQLRVITPMLFIFTVVFVIFYQFQFNPNNPYFTGEDAFYHVAMAKYIMANGIPQKFPYLFFTILNDQFVDHHFLFHLTLIPFIKIFGDVAGAKILIISTVSAIFSVLYLIFREKKLKLALVYPIILFVMMPSDYYFRMSFIRAESASLLYMLVFMLLIVKKKPVALGILAFLYVWLYNAFPFIFVLLFAYLIIQFFTKEKIEAKILLYGALGVILGLVLNPFFPKNIHFFFVQVFVTGLGAKPSAGGEWKPYDSWYWFTISMMPIVLFFLGLIVSSVKNTKKSLLDLIALIMTIILLFLQWKSKRFVEYWPVWGAMTGVLLMGNYFEDKIIGLRKNIKDLEGWILVAGLIVLLPFAINYASAQFSNGLADCQTTWNIPAARDANNRLISLSNKGDIVFTDDWDEFPVYFYLNQKDYYLVGLDPEYMNSYDPGLYQEWANISSGRDSYNLERIKDDFYAKWVLVANDHMQLKYNLDNNPTLFKEVYNNENYFLYKVL